MPASGGLGPGGAGEAGLRSSGRDRFTGGQGSADLGDRAAEAVTGALVEMCVPVVLQRHLLGQVGGVGRWGAGVLRIGRDLEPQARAGPPGPEPGAYGSPGPSLRRCGPAAALRRRETGPGHAGGGTGGRRSSRGCCAVCCGPHTVSVGSGPGHLPGRSAHRAAAGRHTPRTSVPGRPRGARPARCGALRGAAWRGAG